MTTLTPAPGAMAPQISIPGPRTTQPGSSSAAGLTGADVFRIVRQRLVLIIFVWLFLVGLTVLGTWLMIRYYPKFKATALIRVTSINPANLMEPLKPVEVREEEIARLLQDQAVTIQSPEVLFRALEDSEVRATTWHAEAEEKSLKKNESPLDLLGDILKAEPIKDSNLIGVEISWKVPTEATMLVNKIVEKYVANVNERQKNLIRKKEEQLTEEVARAKKELDDKRKEIEAYRGREEVLGTANKQAEEQLLTLTALVTELGVDLLGKKAEWEALKDVEPEELPITPELQAMLNNDPAIYQLQQRLQMAEQELNMAKTRFGPKHRAVTEAQHMRDAIADQIMQDRAQKTLDFQNQQIEQARQNFLYTQEQLLVLQERLTEAQASQRDRDVKFAQYKRMEEEAKMLTAAYEELQDQKRILTIQLRAEKSVQIEIQSMAQEPKRRSSPLWEIWVPAGSILGLGVALGLAFLLELADQSVRTPRDVMRHSIPVLGTIPTTEDDEIEITRVETACLDAPHSITAEAFRNLRANLFFSAPAEQQGVILVTSPSGGNGKTTIASNLAISIALSGRRVLLVDSNFRRASLPRIFPGMRDEGLSNVLIGQCHLDDVVVPTSVPGLDVLSAGPVPPNPAELLGSGYLRDMIVDARARYDQVIFDGPPVLLVSDAMVLAGAVDGVLLVCQYRSTSRGSLQRTQLQLEAINARIFGAVLNKVETRAGGYFRKAYREFYEYHEPGEAGEGEAPPQLKSGTTEQLQASTEGETPGADSASAAAAADGSSTATASTTAEGSEWPASLSLESQASALDIDEQIDRISGDSLLTDEDLRAGGSEDDPNKLA